MDEILKAMQQLEAENVELHIELRSMMRRLDEAERHVIARELRSKVGDLETKRDQLCALIQVRDASLKRLRAERDKVEPREVCELQAKVKELEAERDGAQASYRFCRKINREVVAERDELYQRCLRKNNEIIKLEQEMAAVEPHLPHALVTTLLVEKGELETTVKELRAAIGEAAKL